MNMHPTSATITQQMIASIPFPVGKFLAVLCLLATSLISAVTAAPPETMPIWRVQLQVGVADVSDAGTDDTVTVSLRGGTGTKLDSSRDDFERNTVYTYNLDTAFGVRTIQDLDYLRISKTGSNGVGLSFLRLYVNGIEIFYHDFPGTVYWLDNSGGWSNTLTIQDWELRNNARWVSYVPASSLPITFSRTQLEQRIEGLIGNLFTGGSIFVGWGKLEGSRYVEVTSVDFNTFRVDLDLQEKAIMAFDDAVDIEFKVDVSFVNDRIHFTTHNIYMTGLDIPYQEELTNRIQNEFTAHLNFPFEQLVYTDRAPIFYTGVFVTPEGGLQVGRGIGIVPPQGSAQAPQDDAPAALQNIDELDESTNPFKLRVEAPETIALNEENAFTVLAKSSAATPVTVALQMTLPQGASFGGVLEVHDTNGIRTLNAAQDTNAEGAVVITWQDVLQSGQEASYTIRLRLTAAPEATLTTTARATDMTGQTLDIIEANTTLVTKDGLFRTHRTAQQSVRTKN